MTCGIYVIVNTLNNKRYVGSAVNVDRRFGYHRYKLRHKIHPSNHLQNAWSKYGENSFIFELLEECPREILLEREQWWLDNISFELLYNIAKNAKSSMLGLNHSEETKEKMRESRKRQSFSPETKEKMSVVKRGTLNPNYGKTFSDDHKAKIGAAQRGELSHSYGKPLSEEHKAKLYAANKGRKRSAEAVEKTAEFHRGRKRSEETKQKIRNARLAYFAHKREIESQGNKE